MLTESGKRFFHTKLEEESLKSRGKSDEKVIKQRKRNRLTRVRALALIYTHVGPYLILWPHVYMQFAILDIFNHGKWIRSVMADLQH